MSSQFLLHIHIIISFCDQRITLTVGCGNDHETNCTQLLLEIGYFGFTATESARKYQFVAQFPFLQISRKILLKVFSIFDSLASKRCDGGKANLRSKVKFCLQKCTVLGKCKNYMVTNTQLLVVFFSFHFHFICEYRSARIEVLSSELDFNKNIKDI